LSSSNVEARLRDAQQKKLIIQFARPFEPGTFAGYVMDVGSKFFLLAVLSDGFEFEQYSVLRIADVRRLESPAKRESFYKAVRKIRGDKMPKKMRVDLTNQSSILRSLGPRLVTIHFENITTDSCNIGIVTSDNGIDFEIFEIDSHAKWSAKPVYFRLNEITRIDLPGPYEKALLLAGGEHPPAMTSSTK
jgi:hypothetical protein